MNSLPLVTVFITAYNSEKYISQTIESIINQTYPNIEILIVDDGSTDNTTEIVQSFKDKRIRLLKNEKNMGIPFSRNIGLAKAKGDFIAIIDADDIAYRKRLEKQIIYLNKNPDIDVVGTYYKTMGNKYPRVIKTNLLTPEEIKVYLIFYNNIANPTVLMRKKTLERHNIRYNLNYFVAQDYELWAQISKIGKISIIPEALIKYRVGHANISGQSKKERSYERKMLLSSIHSDLLSYYGFNLPPQRIKLFNEIYNDNPSQSIEAKKKDILSLVSDMLRINNDKKIFNQLLFEKAIYEATIKSILRNNFKLVDKIAIIHHLNRIIQKSSKKVYAKVIIDKLIKSFKSL